ncbi:hypothetical protein [Desulfosporosinus sp.]|uniref:hypothetical protein n=1 Tax=Desulfosporosinus sp. TaxID=157907 RepID=UPI000E8139EF|nr:hypothetical protein [Desulfosporosinus sp.]MBC2721625.1 hypothetical protein [Desulfosporosinus sp.]MBC2728948.1 hypothetical protein [Desulfosporosinus sp.]HBV85419.1 hypothetical protein [Desulfosporosinus sp.]
MLALNRKLKTDNSLNHQHKFQVGDRVKTSNHRIGTVVRLDRDEIGAFIVARLDIIPREFAYDPDDLEIIPKT